MILLLAAFILSCSDSDPGPTEPEIVDSVDGGDIDPGPDDDQPPTVRFTERFMFTGVQQNRLRLFLADTETFEPTPLPFDDVSFGGWSADGERLLITANLDPLTFSGTQIFQMDLATQSLQVVTEDHQDYRFVRWSPDETQLAYIIDRRLYVRNIDGTEERNLTPEPVGENFAAPQWSPDGGTIAVWGLDHEDGVFHSRAQLIDVQSGAASALQYEDHLLFPPTWSPDGMWLLVGVSELDRSAEPPVTIGEDIWRVSFPAGNWQRLTDTAWSEWHPAWSASGDEIVFISDEETTHQIVTMDVSTRRIGHRFDAPGSLGHPVLSPSGEFVLFASSDGEASRYYAGELASPGSFVDLSGSDPLTHVSWAAHWAPVTVATGEDTGP